MPSSDWEGTPSAGQASNTSQGQRIILVHIRSARSENDVAMVYMHPIVGQAMCDTLITNVEHLDKILPKTMAGRWRPAGEVMSEHKR